MEPGAPVHAWYAFASTGEATERSAMDHTETCGAPTPRIDAGSIDGFGELLADDFVELEWPGSAAHEGRDARLLSGAPRAFPDMQMEVDDLLASGDKTVARVRVTATHQGEFMGILPTSNRVDVQLIDISEVR